MKLSMMNEKSVKKRFLNQNELERLAGLIATEVDKQLALGRPINRETILTVMEKEYGKEDRGTDLKP